MIDGVRILDLKKNLDERGYFAEMVRDDWREFLGSDHIVQYNIALSLPGIVRAWHRHLRGQNDYFLCISGAVKVCAYDDREDSSTKGELDEMILNGKERLQIARVVGSCWHGYKSVGNEPALVIYGTSKVYDHAGPDEDRRAWNDGSIVPLSINGNKNDPKVGKVYDWNYPPHR